MKAAEWIDRLKAERGWESDYRVAKELGLSRNTISNYRSKRDSTMDDDTAVKVAVALKDKPEIIILDQVAERTKSESARAALTGLLERIGGKIRGSSGAAGSGRGRLDITSATSICPGGAPDAAAGVMRPEYTSYPAPKPAASPLQLVARALASLTSYGPAHAPA